MEMGIYVILKYFIFKINDIYIIIWQLIRSKYRFDEVHKCST